MAIRQSIAGASPQPLKGQDMAFELKKKESLRKGFKRLGRRQIDKALHSLGHCDRLEAVHEVRKEIKRLRALLRLLRSALAGAGRCTDLLRCAAGQLAAARDAHVRLSAVADLRNQFKQELSSRPFAHIEGVLEADCRREQARASSNRGARNVSRLLKRLGRDWASMHLKKSGWAAIAPGIKHSYRNGRRAYREARAGERPEQFHEWRKRVKDLWHQVGLLCRIWPEQMGAVKTELKSLSKWLGDDHDLSMLTEPSLFKRLRHAAEDEAQVLKAVAQRRQSELRLRSLALGARFYEEKPSIFCNRLARYWKKWRHEPKRLIRSLGNQ